MIPDAGALAGSSRPGELARPRAAPFDGSQVRSGIEGGARACACEPARAVGIGSAASSHATSRYCRCRTTKINGGGSTATAPPWLTPQNPQQLAPCCGVMVVVCEASCADAIPEQIVAIYSGSDTARATARKAPIGASNCTMIENSTIGMKTSSCRRISTPGRPNSRTVRDARLSFRRDLLLNQPFFEVGY